MVNLSVVGRWSFVAGIILAGLAGFLPEATVGTIGAILFILGLIVGFLNITDEESSPFLIAAIALLAIATTVTQQLEFGDATGIALRGILTQFTVFVSAATLVVAIKQIIATAQSD